MNDQWAADLGRWERGELRASDLHDLHPGPDAEALLEMHARVSLVATAPDEQPELTWDELEARLDLDLDAEAERDEEFRTRRRVPLLELAVAFIAGVLVNPFNPAAKTVDGVRAVARETARVVVEEVTEVVDPVVGPLAPRTTSGVVVLHPLEEEKLSAVTPAPADPEETGDEADEGTDGWAPSTPPATGEHADDPGPSPDEPPTPPGHERRPATATPPGHERRPESSAAPERRPSNPSSPSGHDHRAERASHDGPGEGTGGAANHRPHHDPSDRPGGDPGRGVGQAHGRR